MVQLLIVFAVEKGVYDVQDGVFDGLEVSGMIKYGPAVFFCAWVQEDEIFAGGMDLQLITVTIVDELPISQLQVRTSKQRRQTADMTVFAKLQGIFAFVVFVYIIYLYV